MSLFIFIDLVTVEFFSSPLYTLIQYVVLVPVFLYCVRYFTVIKKQWEILSLLMMMIISILWSSYINWNTSYSFRSAFFYVVFLLVLYAFLIVVMYKDKIKEFLGVGKAYIFILVFINDFLMVMLPNQFYNVNGREIGTFFLGNKFNVAYIHLMLLFIVLCQEEKRERKKKKILLYSIVISIVCIYIDCVTVLLALWLFLVLQAIPFQLKRLLFNPIIFSIAFGVSAAFMIIGQKILQFSPIQNFVTTILQRDITLTGRFEVYPYIFRLFDSHMWFGYGFGTDIVKETTGA